MSGQTNHFLLNRTILHAIFLVGKEGWTMLCCGHVSCVVGDIKHQTITQSNHTNQVELETLDPFDDVPILHELDDFRIILFLLFRNSLPLDVKLFQCLPHHIVCSQLTTNLLAVMCCC